MQYNELTSHSDYLLLYTLLGNLPFYYKYTLRF